ncbi:GxxExxY protein [Candidatus Bipolaricaulota bacterium]|nr:GxxExxY protein [Candidatus Bipolaricaulota bacterium]
MALKHREITEQILQAFYKVYHVLGHGFLEKVYENSLAVELRERGLAVQQQAPIRVLYNEHPVGEYFADLVVEGSVIVEIKAAQALTDEHFAQLINYLKATGIEVGLLLNFGPKPEVKRKVFETAKKKASGEETRRGDPRTTVRVRSPRAIQDSGGEDGADNTDR